jgi:hypothetical protein
MQSRGRYRSVLFSVCACLSFPVIWSTVAFSAEPAETEPVPVIQASEVVVSPFRSLTSRVQSRSLPESKCKNEN